VVHEVMFFISILLLGEQKLPQVDNNTECKNRKPKSLVCWAV